MSMTLWFLSIWAGIAVAMIALLQYVFERVAEEEEDPNFTLLWYHDPPLLRIGVVMFLGIVWPWTVFTVLSKMYQKLREDAKKEADLWKRFQKIQEALKEKIE